MNADALTSIATNAFNAHVSSSDLAEQLARVGFTADQIAVVVGQMNNLAIAADNAAVKATNAAAAVYSLASYQQQLQGITAQQSAAIQQSQTIGTGGVAAQFKLRSQAQEAEAVIISMEATLEQAQSRF